MVNLARVLRRLGVGLLLVMPLSAPAALLNFTSSLSGVEGNPASGSPGLGAATGILDTATNVFTWTLSVEGLTAPVDRVHFHGNTDLPPDHADDNRPIVLGFIDTVAPGLVDADVDVLLDSLTGNQDGLFVGVVDLDLVPGALATVDGLVSGRWYLNVHTAAFPGGEIRGQFFRAAPVPVPAGIALLPAALALLYGRRRRRG